MPRGRCAAPTLPRPFPVSCLLSLLSRRSSLLALLLGALAISVGCGARPGVPRPPTVPLQSATLDQLVANFNRSANAVQTMTLKLDLTAKVGKKSYPRVSAFLLTQKPSSIRIWGTFTLLGRLFDMASDGTHFELSLPTRGQFIVGENNVVPPTAASPLAKLRPQVILNALLINPIPPTQHVALDPDTDPSEYEVLVLQPGHDGVEHLQRRIFFSRLDLLPHRQVIYDGDQVHETRAAYSHFTRSGQVPVPQDVTIQRPVEGYSLRLQITSKGITLNKPFPAPHTFDLQPPAGTTIIKISDAARHSPAIGPR